MRNQMLMAAAAAMSLGSGYGGYSISGKQLGQFQLHKWSVMKCDGTPRYVYTPKKESRKRDKIWARRARRGQFTREQRISAAKELVNMARQAQIMDAEFKAKEKAAQ